MKDKMDMVEKLVVQKYPELSGELIWEYIVYRREVAFYVEALSFEKSERLRLKAPLKYKEQILLISKVVGIFFDHMLWDEKEVTFIL